MLILEEAHSILKTANIERKRKKMIVREFLVINVCLLAYKVSFALYY